MRTGYAVAPQTARPEPTGEGNQQPGQAQELDGDYSTVWAGVDDKPWDYVAEYESDEND